MLIDKKQISVEDFYKSVKRAIKENMEKLTYSDIAEIEKLLLTKS